MCSKQSFNDNFMTSESNLPAEAAGSGEAFGRMKILLRTDQFLIAFLLFLTNNSILAATDHFLSSPLQELYRT